MDNPIIAYRKREQLSQTELGARLGVQAPAISKWENGKVPAERVLDVERVTGISRHVLRPDLYPAETGAVVPITPDAGAPVEVAIDAYNGVAPPPEAPSGGDLGQLPPAANDASHPERPDVPGAPARDRDEKSFRAVQGAA